MSADKFENTNRGLFATLFFFWRKDQIRFSAIVVVVLTYVFISAAIGVNNLGEIGGAMYYWIYQDSKKEWRWTLYAANNTRIADSSNGYHNKQDCRDVIDRVKASSNAVVKDGPSHSIRT